MAASSDDAGDTPEQQLLEHHGNDMNLAVATAWKALPPEQRMLYQNRSDALKAGHVLEGGGTDEHALPAPAASHLAVSGKRGRVELSVLQLPGERLADAAVGGQHGDGELPAVHAVGERGKHVGVRSHALSEDVRDEEKDGLQREEAEESTQASRSHVPAAPVVHLCKSTAT
jgi:hypothetical protein